jgi:predicted TIM-barrel fold metal-dependent hydrolase
LSVTDLGNPMFRRQILRGVFLCQIVASELRVTLPVLFHQGVAVCGSKYCRPIYLDDVATNFGPDLKIVAAHAGVP